MEGEEGLLSEERQRLLHENRELDYMTHWVLRMYENKTLPLEDPSRFKVRPTGWVSERGVVQSTRTRRCRWRIPVASRCVLLAGWVVHGRWLGGSECRCCARTRT